MLRPTRLLAFGGLVLIAVLYWKPLHTYLQTKQQLQRRQAQVATLQAQTTELTHQLGSISSGNTLVSEARRLGLVKPNEQLFIVRGISAWRVSPPLASSGSWTTGLSSSANSGAHRARFVA